MLGTVNPLGERARHSRWGVTVSSYVAGSVLGGMALGGTAGIIGSAVGTALPASEHARIAALAIATLAGLMLDMRVFGLRLPSTRRQVNDLWVTAFRDWAYGFGFGFQLGLGVVTMVRTAGTYLTAVASFLTFSPGAGLVIGAAFGLIRGVMVLPGRWIRTPRGLVRADILLARFDRFVARATQVYLAAAAVLLGAAVLRT